MQYVKLFEDFLNEAKPKGAPDWHDSDAPDANGKFKELGIKDLAAWLIKTRNKDLKKITGSLNQQIVFNKNDDPDYADKMDKVRIEVYKQLGREDLLEEGESKKELELERIKLLNQAFKTMPNSPKQLKIRQEIEKIEDLINKLNENEGERDVLGELNEMTLGQLERIADYANMIKDRMESGEQLESWMYSQLTISLENLNAVHDAMDGNDGVEEGKKPGPDAYMTGLDDETEEKKKEQMKKQAEMPDDKDSAYKEMPGDEEAREKGKVKTSKHTKSYHELYGESIDEAEKKQSTDKGPIDSEAIETGLKNKADETGVPIGILRAVMRRGMAAWKTGHRPGVTEQQWGYARVNSFLTKQDGTWGGADKDLAKEVRDGGHDKKLK